jgi:hypothetical protein
MRRTALGNSEALGAILLHGKAKFGEEASRLRRKKRQVLRPRRLVRFRPVLGENAVAQALRIALTLPGHLNDEPGNHGYHRIVVTH